MSYFSYYVTPRSAALAAGREYYFTGKPCENGHVDERLISTRRCVACLLIEKAVAHHGKEGGTLMLCDSGSNSRTDYEWQNLVNTTIPKMHFVHGLRIATRFNLPNYIDGETVVWRVTYGQRLEYIPASENLSTHEKRKRATPKWANRELINAFYVEAKRLRELDGQYRHVHHEIPLHSKIVCGLHVHNNLKIEFAMDNIKMRNHFRIETTTYD